MVFEGIKCRRSIIAKGWPFDPDKDTCVKLVGICRDKQLFPPLYAPILKATETIRNKISDAHGRGPKPRYPVEKKHADHMIRLASTNMTFLTGLAGL
jgi:Abortive infection C-terminus